jgi:hypothetical protein
MLAMHTVPASRRVRRHSPTPNGPLAVDVYARAGSIIVAPLPGKVVFTSCPDSPTLPGCQIRGFLRLPDGRGMPFVLAHLQPGTFPREGQTFRKGATLGRMEHWEQHPGSTHVHWAFRNPGESVMPPPASIPVLRAFELCGPAPTRSVMELDVAEIEAEDSEDFEHGDIEVVVEEFEYDAEDFEDGDLEESDEESK